MRVYVNHIIQLIYYVINYKFIHFYEYFRYFGAFHVLSVFIILAIGADDTFVFYDTWKLSQHFRYILLILSSLLVDIIPSYTIFEYSHLYRYPTLEHRLSNCYRKAGLAMLFTSITTAVAFGLSAMSPFLG